MNLRIFLVYFLFQNGTLLQGAEHTALTPTPSAPIAIQGKRTPDSGQESSPSVIWGGEKRESYSSTQFMEDDISYLEKVLKEKPKDKQPNPLLQRRLWDLKDKLRQTQQAVTFVALTNTKKGSSDATEY